MICKICGKNNDPDAVFCDECGNKLIKEKKDPVNYFNNINWRAVLIGSIIGSVFGILFTIILSYLFLGYIPLSILIGAIVGYIVDENWKEGAKHGGIASAIISIMIMIIISIQTFIGFNFTYNLGSFAVGAVLIFIGLLLLIFSTLLGYLGGIIGSFIRKFIKNRQSSD